MIRKRTGTCEIFVALVCSPLEREKSENRAVREREREGVFEERDIGWCMEWI